MIDSLSSDTELVKDPVKQKQSKTFKKVDDDISKVIDSLSSDKKLVKESKEVKNINEEKSQMKDDTGFESSIEPEPNKDVEKAQEVGEDNYPVEDLTESDEVDSSKHDKNGIVFIHILKLLVKCNSLLTGEHFRPFF